MYGRALPVRSNTLSLVLAMLQLSFRWCVSRFVPCSNPRKRAVLAVVLLFLAGCGGGGGSTQEQVVRAGGYRFSAPPDWNVSRGPRELRLSQGVNLLSVTRFPLLR